MYFHVIRKQFLQKKTYYFWILITKPLTLDPFNIFFYILNNFKIKATFLLVMTLQNGKGCSGLTSNQSS